jgi:hypothetical protein
LKADEAVVSYLSLTTLVRMIQETESIEVREEVGRAMGDWALTRAPSELIDPIWPNQ